MTAPASPAATTRLDASLQLLRTLSGPHGIHASAAATANYRAVFTRDAVMAGVAGLATGDAAITAALVRTLEGLRAVQGAEGQIASNYELRAGWATQVSFGTLAPRLDGATWYLMGVALAARAGALDLAAFRDSVRLVVRLLDALEYNGRHLVYVPAGGNWADEYVYEGYILYDQLLRAWALRLLGALYDEPLWATKSAQVEAAIEASFWPDDVGRWHPLAAHSPLVARDLFDLAAAALLGASGVAPRIGAAVLDGIASRFLAREALPPAFAPVIHEGDPDWPALRRYHLHGFRNRPHEYHNGGIWPIWIGWLALALARTGRTGELAHLRRAADQALDRLPGFAFEEYLHGVTGAAGGTPQMAYTATGIVFLHVADAPATLALLAP